MKKFRITKKVVAFVLSVLLVCSTASVAVVEPLAAGEHQHQFGTLWTIATEATCKEEGSRYKECTVDGCTYKLQESLPIDINNHNYQQTEVKIQATCEVSGVEIYTCIWCGNECNKYVEMLPHTVNEDKWQVTKEAKCNKPGTEKNVCTVCDKKVLRDITVEHDVDYSKVLATVDPTCSTEGVNCYDCKNCTDLVKEPIPVVADNHTFTVNPFDITGLTCKTNGKGKVVCKECGLLKEVEVSKSKAHEYLDWIVKTPLPEDADCTTSAAVGTRVRYCSVCNTNTAIETFYPQHKLATGYSTRLSTCMKNGYNRGDCIVCMETGVDVILPIDEDAHLWKEVVLEEATCAKEGQVLKVCTLNDGHVVFEDIPKLEHIVTGNWLVIEPNCTEEGSRYNECTSCGLVSEIIPVDKDAHVFADDVQWVQDPLNKPTCYKEGKEVAMCQKCFKTISRTVPKHFNTRVVYSYTAPTCFTEGKIEYACTACSSGVGDVISETIPKDSNAHVKSTRKAPVILPTCYSEGLKAYTCIFCDYVYSGEDDDAEAVPTTPHTVTDWEVTVRPTCKPEREGLKTRKCVNENCNHVESRVMAAAHNFTTWKPVEGHVATCQASGLRERFCYTCNYSETETYIDTHIPGEWEFAQGNSCKTGGKAYLKCKVCELYYDEKTVAPGKHVELTLISKNYSGDEASCYSEIYECAACDAEIKNVLPHMWMQTQAPIDPDCVTPGLSEAKYCPICLYDSPATVVAPVGHEFRYDDEGTKYCTKCNIYFVEDGVNGTCDHFCHNKGIVTKILNKFLAFFWKLFGTNHLCKCGVAHYHEDAVKVLSSKIDESGKVVEITFTCSECKGLSSIKTITF